MTEQEKITLLQHLEIHLRMNGTRGVRILYLNPNIGEEIIHIAINEDAQFEEDNDLKDKHYFASETGEHEEEGPITNYILLEDCDRDSLRIFLEFIYEE